MAKVALDAAGVQLTISMWYPRWPDCIRIVSIISSEHCKPEGLLFATKTLLVGRLAPGICLSLNHNAMIISMCSHGIFLLYGCRRLNSCSYSYHTTIVWLSYFNLSSEY